MKTKKERLAQFTQDRLEQPFTLTTVCRSDIAQALADADKDGCDQWGEPKKKYVDIALFFTDAEMKQLAAKLESFAVDEDTYWNPIREFVKDRIELEKKRNEKKKQDKREEETDNTPPDKGDIDGRE